MRGPAQVRIVEVGPRDGLQNEPVVLSVGQRAALVEALAEAGLRTIEAGSFVSARRVPQMASTGEVLKMLRLPAGVETPVLVPNSKGFVEAKAADARAIAVFASASETFNYKNIGCGVRESLARYNPVVEQARSSGMRVRGYVSCVFGCPYEGPVRGRAVLVVASALAAMGCDEIALSDTIGVGTADVAYRLAADAAREVGVERVAIHFHDTYGQALANVLSCLEAGVSIVDASVAGLGGCPYAPGATGNLATEDLVYALDGMGVATGVNLERLARAGRAACVTLGVTTRSRAALALACRANQEDHSCSTAG